MRFAPTRAVQRAQQIYEEYCKWWGKGGEDGVEEAMLEAFAFAGV
jgi:hypothetical protein